VDGRHLRALLPRARQGALSLFECYAGKVGAPFGVKLEDQVLVTKDWPKLICAYPYDAKLLG